MKTSNFWFILLLVFFAGLVVGCKPKTPQIGILMHSLKNERWNKDKAYLVENLEKLGAKVMVSVADNDQRKQIAQAEGMIKDGAQVLIVVSINQDESAKIVELAHESDVKVIAYDRMINGCDLDYYISTNSTRVGEMQASCLTSLRPKGKYALIGGSKYDNNAMRLFIGQMNVLQPFMERGDIQVAYSEFSESWTASEGALHTNMALDQNPDTLAAIIAGSDAIADGVLATLKERGLEGKILVAGQDADLANVKAIMNGTQTCTIMKPIKEMSALTAELALSLALDKPIKLKFTNESNGKALVKSVVLDAILVDKNNIENTVIASGFHKASDLQQ